MFIQLLGKNQIVWITWMLILVSFVLFCLCTTKSDAGVGVACYVCTSENGSNPSCEDPIQPGSTVPLISECSQGRSGHSGLFVAQYCAKIKGIRLEDNKNIIVRRCTLEKLTDTESHCGQFKLDDALYRGCIATCTKDGCNSVDSRARICFALVAWCLLLSFLNIRFSV